MNDFDYDILQKRRVARGAIHRKNGSKSKRCRLPHENLTPKQLKGLNGQVMQYAMNEPKDWSGFKALPMDLQKEYVRNIVGTYSCSCTELGEMFGKHPQTVRNYFKNNDFGINFPRGGRGSSADKERFLAFVNGGQYCSESPTPDVLYSAQETDSGAEELSESVEERMGSGGHDMPKLRPEPMVMSRVNMTFEGTMDSRMISNSIAHILRNGVRCRVHIECEVLE